MIEKMKYVNISGPIEYIQRATEYIDQYPIQLEHAARELVGVPGIEPYISSSPYGALLRQAEGLVSMLGSYGDGRAGDMQEEKARTLMEEAANFYDKRGSHIRSLENRQKSLEDFMASLAPFTGLDIHLEDLSAFEFLTYRFGKMPLNSFAQFKTFLHDDGEILFVEGSRDGAELWGVYFTPTAVKDKVDSIFSALHFERIWISYELEGVPLQGTLAQVYDELLEKRNMLLKEIEGLKQDAFENAGFSKEELGWAYETLKRLSRLYELRKYAAKTRKGFYIFVGWMPEKDALRLQASLEEREQDEKLVLILEEANDAIISKPPTRLKNFSLFRPFEFFVKMYGLPSYGEIDPTPFVALTYMLLFGIMFGDVGQGALLSLAGFFLYKKKGMPLGGVISMIGLSSMVFGALYGSFFGYELEALWMKPSENANTILFTAVGIGVVIIGLSMLLNLLNAVRQKRWGKLIFEPSGIAGVIFYGSLVYFVCTAVMGGHVSSLAVALCMGPPLVCMTFREPLECLVEGKRFQLKTGLSQFILESVIEMFEVMLSYFTNTVSFVRVGAFALSHAGMMGVVMLISETAQGHSILILALGNLFVVALEGLVVGIQVLRLEFYEMFSRFFEGKGRKFVSE